MHIGENARVFLNLPFYYIRRKNTRKLCNFCKCLQIVHIWGCSTFLFDKKVAKKQKSLQDLSGLVSARKSVKERASPRRDVYLVPRKHSAEPRGEGTIHRVFTVCERAIGAIYYGFFAVRRYEQKVTLRGFGNKAKKGRLKGVQN